VSAKLCILFRSIPVRRFYYGSLDWMILQLFVICIPVLVLSLAILQYSILVTLIAKIEENRRVPAKDRHTVCIAICFRAPSQRSDCTTTLRITEQNLIRID
jgi:hypothetical protein